MPYGADMRIMTERMPSAPTAIPDAETLAGLAGAIPGLLGDLRSDHAGETGAVMIYLGILAGARSARIRDFARAHLMTERQHLAQFAALLPLTQRSVLLPLWRVAGWLTVFCPRWWESARSS
jgi:ubiquinone biosynthesis monooxygenase Coq7